MSDRSGCSVIEQTVVQRERWPGRYGAKCTPLVYPEQKVSSDQPVLRLENTEPREYSSNNTMHVPASEIVPSGLRGHVVKITPRGGVVIESRVTLVRGAIGVGNQVAGILTLWSPDGRSRVSSSLAPGTLLVVPGPIDFAFLHQALVSGVSGVIASSILARDLEGFLRIDLIQLLESDDIEKTQTHLPPVTLFLTEGLGTFAMSSHVFDLLSHYQDTIALLTGVTSVHKSIFPELVISLI